MSTAMIGGLVGMVIGFVGFAALRKVADTVERDRARDAGRRTASLLRTVAVLDVLVMTVLGYFVASMIWH